MGDDEGLSALRNLLGGTHDRPGHSLGDLDVGLSPARGERVRQMTPVTRITQSLVALAEDLPLEDIGRLDDVGIDTHLELRVHSGDGGHRLPGALQRGAHQGGQLNTSEMLGSTSGHSSSQW